MKTGLDLCKVIEFPRFQDRRGNLTALQSEIEIPFDLKRIYYLYDVPGGAERGGHAHRTTHQMLIAMSGSFDVTLDDGRSRKKFHLNRAYYGLYVAPMVWRELDNFSSGSVCLALASTPFNEKDYCREYNSYKESLLVR